MNRALGTTFGFAAVMAVIYFVVPLAYPPADLTLIQAAVAFVARAVLAPELPDIYLVNGSNDEEDAE